MNNKSFRLFASILVILLIFAQVRLGAKVPAKLRVLTGDSVHLSIGIPHDNDTTDDYIIVRKQYALSYNKNTNITNWVSYELNSKWYGDAPRYSGSFISDTSLPIDYLRVKHTDYTNTGFDRGHLVRSEERTDNDEDNKSTFLLTNVIPQRPDLNRGPWLNFEYYCEDLCKKQNKELFIITGPIGSVCHIDTNSRVCFPVSCYKIVIVLDKNQNILDIKPSTKIIAVLMPNDIGIRKDKWEKYKTTVRKIEKLSGYNFLDFLPDDLQDILENKIAE